MAGPLGRCKEHADLSCLDLCDFVVAGGCSAANQKQQSFPDLKGLDEELQIFC